MIIKKLNYSVENTSTLEKCWVRCDLLINLFEEKYSCWLFNSSQAISSDINFYNYYHNFNFLRFSQKKALSRIIQLSLFHQIIIFTIIITTSTLFCQAKKCLLKCTRNNLLTQIIQLKLLLKVFFYYNFLQFSHLNYCITHCKKLTVIGIYYYILMIFYIL